jgi:hypothetical protein|nr:anthranilate synthase component II [uncultured Aggregatibacter sp.]
MSLLIINNHDSFTFNLVDYIRRLNVPFQVVNVEELDLDAVGDFSHLLISPGPDVPRAYPQLFDLLARYQHSKSILGVCLGHQMLCEFFGAELHNLPTPRHGQAKQLQCATESRLFKNMPPTFQIGLYHSWAVSEQNFPSALQITARCDDNIIMAMQHKTLPIYGVQFHPESYISEYGEQILRNWLLDS